MATNDSSSVDLREQIDEIFFGEIGDELLHDPNYDAAIEQVMALFSTKAEQLAADKIKNWVEHEAKVLNVENIEHIRNGQYIRVERILAFAATLNKGTKL